MLKKLFFSALLLALFTCVPLTHSTMAGQDFPLLLTDATAVVIDTEERVVSATRSIPPSITTKTVAWIYRINVSITVDSDSIWNRPFGIHIQSGSGEEEILRFNEEGRTLPAGSQTVFSGRVRFTLDKNISVTLFSGSAPTIDEFRNPTRHRVIYFPEKAKQ